MMRMPETKAELEREERQWQATIARDRRIDAEIAAKQRLITVTRICTWVILVAVVVQVIFLILRWSRP